MYRQTVAVLDRAAGGVDVGEVERGIDTLAEQVQRERDHVDVAGPLPVAEQRALDPVGAGHDAELGGGHRGAAVVVRVQREHDRVAGADVAVEPLDLVPVDVGRRHLDGGRKIQDHRARDGRLPDVHHRFADLLGEVELGAGEALGRVLEVDVGPGDRRHEPATELGRAHRDVDDAGAVEAEHHAALERRRRVVEVHERLPRPADRLEGALDLLGPSLGEDLDHDVVGDQILLDEQPHEVEVGLGGRGEAHLDLLEPAAHHQIEHLGLALDVHGIDQGLVAVAQVDAAPARGPRDDATRPRAIR